MTKKIRVRYAPSPTGYQHIGGVRTALYNYFFAKHHGGDFLCRIEDTDRTRFVAGAEKYIQETFEWCGAPFDESPWNPGDFGPYRQSERKEMYMKYALQLIESGHAYYAFDTTEELDIMRQNLEAQGNPSPQYNSITRQYMKNSTSLPQDEVQRRLEAGEAYVIRIKMPRNEDIKMQDIIRGWVVVNSSQMDDKVLMKSDGMPTYHLANIVDDYLMQITHVIRAEEWLPSLPLHVYLYRSLGWEADMPQFAHLPVMLKPDGNGKLSKRDGDRLGFSVFPLAYQNDEGQTVQGLREMGFLPEAFVNMLAFFGWNPGTDQEIFSMEQLIQSFTLERVGKSGARFDFEKAKWFNHQHLIRKDFGSLEPQLRSILTEHDITNVESVYLEKVWHFVKERCIFVVDFWKEGHYFFTERENIDQAVLEKGLTDKIKALITDYRAEIESGIEFQAATLESHLKAKMQEQTVKPGEIFPSIRVLLSGQKQGPPMFEMMELLGKNLTLQRLGNFI